MTHVVCQHCQGVNRVPELRLTEDPQCGKCKGALFKSAPIALDAAGFERFVGNSELPLLVDFWAPWCGPCRMMAPAFEQAAKQLEPRIQLLKVNTEQQQALAAKYNIRSIPTLILFRSGRELARMSGALDAQGLVQWAEQNL